MLIDNLRHFNRREAWGRPTRINGALLLVMDELADRVKFQCPQCDFIIHNAYRPGTTGQHPLLNAVDFHLTWLKPLPAYHWIIETLGEMQCLEHVGLGVYPEWEYPGFHLDVRGTKARWAQVGGKYVGIDEGIKLLKSI